MNLQELNKRAIAAAKEAEKTRDKRDAERTRQKAKCAMMMYASEAEIKAIEKIFRV